MEVIVFCLIVVCFYNYKIVAAFRGMHVTPAKHSFRKCDRRTDGQTDGRAMDKVIPMCRYALQATQKSKFGSKCMENGSQVGFSTTSTFCEKEILSPISSISIHNFVKSQTCNTFLCRPEYKSPSLVKIHSSSSFCLFL